MTLKVLGPKELRSGGRCLGGYWGAPQLCRSGEEIGGVGAPRVILGVIRLSRLEQLSATRGK